MDGSLTLKFAESSVIDLALYTLFLRQVKKCFDEKWVYAIEETVSGDRNLVFHIVDQLTEEKEVCMVSAKFILEFYGEKTEDE